MIEFKLPDMTCGHCVSRVTQTLRLADPAGRVTIDLPSQTVKIDTAATRQSLAAALTEAGYAPLDAP